MLSTSYQMENRYCVQCPMLPQVFWNVLQMSRIGSRLSARINIWVVCLLKDIDVASVGTKNVFVSFSGSSCKRASGNSSSRGISPRYLWDTKPSTIIYTARHIVQNLLQEIFKREDNSRQRSWQQFICWIAETWEEEKINIFLKVCTTWKIFSRCACFGLVQCASRSVFCNCVQMCAVGR